MFYFYVVYSVKNLNIKQKNWKFRISFQNPPYLCSVYIWHDYKFARLLCLQQQIHFLELNFKPLAHSFKIVILLNKTPFKNFDLNLSLFRSANIKKDNKIDQILVRMDICIYLPSSNKFTASSFKLKFCSC